MSSIVRAPRDHASHGAQRPARAACYNPPVARPALYHDCATVPTEREGVCRRPSRHCSAAPSGRSLNHFRRMSRPLLAQINLAALSANLARARELAAGAQVLAVVKADAYGHGLMRVLPALEQADGLALLELDAAVALRERHYTRRILLLEGFFEERELAEIAQPRLAIVVHHLDQVAMLERAALTRP